MKTMSKIFAKVGTGALMAGLALNFNACTEQSPFEPDDRKDFSANEANKTAGTAKEQGSMTSRYSSKLDAFKGGKITLSQGSQFELLDGSLTPPPELYGKDVTLTMTVVQDEVNNELLFEFGPHGSTFAPAATVRFHYSGSSPKLYYVEDDGTYTEQKPDEVDLVNGWVKLTINHFSRYALAWSN